MRRDKFCDVLMFCANEMVDLLLFQAKQEKEKKWQTFFLKSFRQGNSSNDLKSKENEYTLL